LELIRNKRADDLKVFGPNKKRRGTMITKMKNVMKGEFTMRTVRLVAVAVFALSMLLAARPANADIPTCHQLIQGLREATAGVTISEKDRATLQSKLTDADAKIDQAKFCDALGKLIQFREKVNSLLAAAKPKISQEDADLLLSGVNDAIACVQELITNAGTTCP